MKLDGVRKIFCSHCVKPLVGSALVKETVRDPAACYSRIADKEEAIKHDFKTARQTEIEILMSNGTFKQVNSRTIDPRCHIFGSVFVDEVKKTKRSVCLKSRLISQRYQDEVAATIATKPPTAQRYTPRLSSCVAFFMRNMQVHRMDATQTYVQPNTRLERDVYHRPPL